MFIYAKWRGCDGKNGFTVGTRGTSTDRNTVAFVACTDAPRADRAGLASHKQPYVSALAPPVPRSLRLLTAAVWVVAVIRAA